MPRPFQCPVDGSVLREDRYEGDVHVDTCPDCNGTWLEKGELDRVLHTRERAAAPASEAAVVEGAYDMARDREAPALNCPDCGGPLARSEFGFTSQVLVDVCPMGCGKWLDAGEIAALERFYEANRPAQRPLPGFMVAILAMFGA